MESASKSSSSLPGCPGTSFRPLGRHARAGTCACNSQMRVLLTRRDVIDDGTMDDDPCLLKTTTRHETNLIVSYTGKCEPPVQQASKQYTQRPRESYNSGGSEGAIGKLPPLKISGSVFPYDKSLLPFTKSGSQASAISTWGLPGGALPQGKSICTR